MALLRFQQLLIPSPDQILPWLRLLPIEYLIQLLTSSYKLLLDALSRLRDPSALYEVLDYQAQLEIKNPKGQKAVYRRRQRVRFLQDNVSTLYDYGWETGNAFASHRVQPGHLVERKKIGQRYRSLLVLAEPQHKGDELTLSVRRLVKDKFTGKGNWLEGEVRNRTHRMRLTVILPASPRVSKAHLVQRRQAKEVPVSVKPLTENRQRLEATITNPRIGDMYTLVWDW